MQQMTGSAGSDKPQRLSLCFCPNMTSVSLECDVGRQPSHVAQDAKPFSPSDT